MTPFQAPHDNERLIFFAGGGTGGHIFPNLAVLETLTSLLSTAPVGSAPKGHGHADTTGHFLISNRPLDARILSDAGQPSTTLPIGPLPAISAPWRWPGFISSWRASVRAVRRLIHDRRPAALVATGGFVSGPAVVAARRAGLPVALVNLDAVAGKSNRSMARSASQIFTVYPDALPGKVIGMPLRAAAIGPGSHNATAARRQLSLDPDRQTLLITGGSQGATSINQFILESLKSDRFRSTLQGWQVMHLTGDRDQAAITDAYRAAGVPAHVSPFCDRMGLAWSAASLAISRAGAGSVAEAWANATPTLFLPYPHHKDQHQKHNLAPLLQHDAALVFDDRIDPQANVQQTLTPLLQLMATPTRRTTIADRLRATWPGNGADTVAQWLAGYVS